MAMSKIERIDREIQKTREKITEYQNKLKGLEAQKTEAENLEIVQLVCIIRTCKAGEAKSSSNWQRLSGSITPKRKVIRSVTLLICANLHGHIR